MTQNKTNYFTKGQLCFAKITEGYIYIIGISANDNINNPYSENNLNFIPTGPIMPETSELIIGQSIFSLKPLDQLETIEYSNYTNYKFTIPSKILEYNNIDIIYSPPVISYNYYNIHFDDSIDLREAPYYFVQNNFKPIYMMQSKDNYFTKGQLCFALLDINYTYVISIWINDNINNPYSQNNLIFLPTGPKLPETNGLSNTQYLFSLTPNDISNNLTNYNITTSFIPYDLSNYTIPAPIISLFSLAKATNYINSSIIFIENVINNTYYNSDIIIGSIIDFSNNVIEQQGKLRYYYSTNSNYFVINDTNINNSDVFILNSIPIDISGSNTDELENNNYDISYNFPASFKNTDYYIYSVIMSNSNNYLPVTQTSRGQFYINPTLTISVNNEFYYFDHIPITITINTGREDLFLTLLLQSLSIVI